MGRTRYGIPRVPSALGSSARLRFAWVPEGGGACHRGAVATAARKNAGSAYGTSAPPTAHLPASRRTPGLQRDPHPRRELHGGLGLDTRGDHVDELSGLLAARGVEPIGWFGVRLFTDGWSLGRPATDPEDLVLRVELEASRRDPYRRLSRLFHLLARAHR